MGGWGSEWGRGSQHPSYPEGYGLGGMRGIRGTGGLVSRAMTVPCPWVTVGTGVLEAPEPSLGG